MSEKGFYGWNPIVEEDERIDAARVTQNWPFALLEYWNRTKTPDAADFTFS